MLQAYFFGWITKLVPVFAKLGTAIAGISAAAAGIATAVTGIGVALGGSYLVYDEISKDIKKKPKPMKFKDGQFLADDFTTENPFWRSKSDTTFQAVEGQNNMKTLLQMVEKSFTQQNDSLRKFNQENLKIFLNIDNKTDTDVTVNTYNPENSIEILDTLGQ